MTTLAVIPARGGSKGIPRKNVRPLAGRPLIAWTIEDALCSPSIDRVVVSTDDAEIRRVSLEYGAEVVDRPASIAGDRSPSEAALLHVLDVLEAAEGYRPDVLVFLQCTSPLRRAHDIEDAVRTFREGGYDSLFGAWPAQPFRWRRRGDVMERLDYDVGVRPMRQDRPIDYIENGSIYVMTTRLLRETGVRLGGRIGCHEMPMPYSLDIDGEEEFRMVEALMTMRGPRPKPAARALRGGR